MKQLVTIPLFRQAIFGGATTIPSSRIRIALKAGFVKRNAKDLES